MQLASLSRDRHEYLLGYKSFIYSNVVRCAKALAKAVVEQELAPKNEEIWKHVGHIIDADDIEGAWSKNHKELDPKLVAGIAAIVDSPFFITREYDEFGVPSSTE